MTKKDNRTDYMASNYERRENDFYPTMDTRCIDGLINFFPEIFDHGAAVDMCANEGSGIVDYLKSSGLPAIALPDAFAENLEDPAGELEISWGITNPPYDRKLVYKILNRQVERVRKNSLTAGGLDGFAALMRTAFDHSKDAYRDLFESHFYRGQIKLCFRPFWTPSRAVEPFHSYVWHLWTSSKPEQAGVWHYYAPEDPRYKILKSGDLVTFSRVADTQALRGEVGRILYFTDKKRDPTGKRRAVVGDPDTKITWAFLDPEFLDLYIKDENHDRS